MKQVGIFTLFGVFLASSSVVFAQDDEKRKGSRRPQQGLTVERWLKSVDKDNDGKIALAEAPERMQERFGQMDTNGDGFVDASELKKAVETRNRRSGQNPRGNPDSDRRKKGKRASGDSDAPRPDFGQRRAPGMALDIEKLFKEMDQDGDGNLNPQEQKAVIAKFNEFQAKMRQRMRSGGDAGKKRASDRARPDTDPVKPKRPDMEE